MQIKCLISLYFDLNFLAFFKKFEHHYRIGKLGGTLYLQIKNKNENKKLEGNIDQNL